MDLIVEEVIIIIGLNEYPGKNDLQTDCLHPPWQAQIAGAAISLYPMPFEANRSSHTFWG